MRALAVVAMIACASACVPAPIPGRGRSAARADATVVADASADDAAAVDAEVVVADDAAASGVDAEVLAVDGGATIDGGDEALDGGVIDGGALRPDTGGAAPDGGAAAPDGGAVSPDGGPASPDAGPTPVACTAEGAAGECIDTSACLAPAHSVPGHCPGPANIQCCVTTTAPPNSCDPMVMPPAAHAGLTEAPGRDNCPPGMIGIATACVDRYEAVLFEVGAGGALTAWSPFFNPGARVMRAASIEGVTPQAYIDGRQAEAACVEAGKRLCTDAEWLRACRGPANTTYPYGAARQPGVCNDARAQHPAVEYFGTSAQWIWSELGNACIDQLPASLALTGSHPGCVTAEGALDMMGNLHEWTADPAGTFRGGYYVDTVINGNGCLYATTAHDRGHWDYSTGFRCCADRP